MSRIYLIRHGRTEANEKKLYCGSTDLPLSLNGCRELKAFGESVSEDCLFFTSGMLRTEQTLECLFGPVEHYCELRLREMNFGVFEMKSYDQLKADPEYQAWISGQNEKNRTPGGESGEEMAVRAVEAFEEIRKSGKDVVIVTHGGVIAALMAHLFPEASRSRYAWQPEPGHGYCLENNYFRII